VRAKRSLGQNFLVDPNLQRKIVEAVDAAPGETVVEIGPGRGALTRHLARTGADLLAIELDRDLAADLAVQHAQDANVTIIHSDILVWDPGQLRGDSRIKVVGNIPYNITSPILFRLLEWRPIPESIVIMVQKEVADRILAGPGEKAYGALTVGVQAQAAVERLFTVGRNAFRPVPAVESTVIRIRPRPATGPGTGAPLRTLTRAAFGMRRKQLQKMLRSSPEYQLSAEEAEQVLTDLGLRPEDRPETLAPHTFVRLAAALQRLGHP
jgi:16S rRNA (adenine1518-N6/adenine1519-N6)-dimethyltransferase